MAVVVIPTQRCSDSRAFSTPSATRGVALVPTTSGGTGCSIYDWCRHLPKNFRMMNLQFACWR